MLAAMSKTIQLKLATVALLALSAAMAICLLSIFVLPKLEASWRKEPMPMGGWQRGLVALSHSTSRNSAPLLGIVLALFVAAVVWRVVTARQLQRLGQQGFPMSDP